MHNVLVTAYEEEGKMKKGEENRERGGGGGRRKERRGMEDERSQKYGKEVEEGWRKEEG